MHWIAPSEKDSANGSMSYNQSGGCPARGATSTPEAKMHGLGRQRDIRRALIEADLVECLVARCVSKQSLD